MRIAEKQRELVRQSEVDELIDGMAGVLLTALSSMPAQCAPLGDLPMRRRLEQWVSQTRAALAGTFNKMADEAGEPPIGGCRMMPGEMTGDEVAAQIARADNFIAAFRQMVATAVVDPASLAPTNSAAALRGSLRRSTRSST